MPPKSGEKKKVICKLHFFLTKHHFDYFSRLAERQLLGKLHADHIYLRNFVNSNLLKKAYAVHGEDEVPSSTHTKVSHVIHADPYYRH